MPRQKATSPAYCFHVSGQARVNLDGRTFYLGEHGSKESWAKYYALLAEYHANGLTMPPERDVRLADAVLSVRCVTGEFRQHVLTKYANNAQRAAHFENLCSLLEQEFGEVPVANFGPRRLAELRDLLVATGNTRRYINTQVNDIVAIFRYGLSREIVTAETIIGLESLEALRFGQTDARESKRVEPVEIEHVRKTAPFLSTPIRAMLRLQLATAMRPSEIFAMRPMDIDQSGEVWVYRPESHKTLHLGKTKVIPIVGDSQAVLAPFLARAPDAYCFSPAESKKWYQEQRSAKRVTPLSCGDRPGSKPVKENPMRAAGDKFTKDTYRRAIERAAKKAKVPHWHPYQLRHLVATTVREALDVESAQALLGHSRPQMTEHYAKLSLAKAIQAAKVAPEIGDMAPANPKAESPASNTNC